MAKINNPWTEKDKSILRKMWGNGETSTTIAKKLDRTRSSVMGLINREGMQRGNSPLDGKKLPSKAPKPKKAKTQKPKKEKVQSLEGRVMIGQAVMTQGLNETEFAPEGQKLYRLGDLPNRGCRWPFGDSRHKDGLWFCGIKQKENSPYCCNHHTISKNDKALKPIRPMD